MNLKTFQRGLNSYAASLTLCMDLNEGCIIAMRHIHMSPADAAAAGVRDGDIVSVKADNERGTIFNQVKIRVNESFTLEMHIDTDEANASKIKTGDSVTIIR